MQKAESLTIEERIRTYAATRVPGLGRERVVLAASGGADSAAMVALLCEAGIVAPGRAVVAHFDHRLRDPAEAALDLDAVRALCGRYGLALETGAWSAPRGGEAAAREARYAFLRETAERNRARAIVTGHTSDDQVETLVMHALRGAGLHGLAGMAPVAPLAAALAGGASGLEVWRPLLGVSREETRGYCAARGLPFHDDATNLDRAFLRNRVRLDLLPAMEAAAPGAGAAMLALAEQARESVAALEEIASSAIAEDLANEVMLSRAALRGLPAGAAPYAYRLALVRLLGDARDIERRHYDVLAQAASAATGSMFELPRGVIATVDADAVVLSLGAPGAPPIAPGFAVALPYAGAAGAWSIEVAPTGAATHDAAPGEMLTLALPADAVVRGRRPGDRVALRGGGHKKLQDVYVDAKAPRRERDAAPVIAVGADVLWTPLASGAMAPASEGVPHRVWWRRAARRS
jgi:tRNA(Ile)-lysidine synthase